MEHQTIIATVINEDGIKMNVKVLIQAVQLLRTFVLRPHIIKKNCAKKLICMHEDRSLSEVRNVQFEANVVGK